MFQIIDPVKYPTWDDLLLTNTKCSFFHSSHWARVLQESYGYTAHYFTVINDNKLSGLIPVLEINSLFTGKRGVSLPFTDWCETIIPEEYSFQKAMREVIEYGKRFGWKSIELRSGMDMSQEIPTSSVYYGHRLNLLQGKDTLFSN